MAATNLNHVSVCAPDLAESIRFYRRLLGVEPVPTPNFGFPVQWLRVGPLQLHLFERPGEGPQYHHLGITVDDFEAVYRTAAELDVFDRTTFGHHLYELPGNNVQLYVRDPGGNLVEIDWPDVTTLPDDIRADMKRMEDRFPQTEDNMRATLFLEGAPTR